MIRIDEGKYIIEERDLKKLLEDTALNAIATYEKQKKSRYKFTPEGCISRQDLIQKIGRAKVDAMISTGVITKIKNGKKNSKVFFSTKELARQGVTID